MSTTELHPTPRLRMSGVMCLFSLYTFTINENKINQDIKYYNCCNWMQIFLCNFSYTRVAITTRSISSVTYLLSLKADGADSSVRRRILQNSTTAVLVTMSDMRTSNLTKSVQNQKITKSRYLTISRNRYTGLNLLI